MKQIKGVVELHGEDITIKEGNNEKYVSIDGISTYDFNSVIMGQTTSWKLDLIKDICSKLKKSDIKKLSGMVNGLYSKDDLTKCWDSATLHNNEAIRIKEGRSMFPKPISDNKEEYFKDKI